ncbi:response regulator transcription factor [Rhodoferax aquaticus]|uniref:Response regulator transcription factor n=1 Tax=Rhodoferax aquaticus TaxID=2527691 RepID=A0A515EVQ8_9BURK|nr:response regulator transcription factor [Rhodoferax aquaticus]QDL56728.1 response regulator transcription factor [Rhodoferax aquaticus]
MRRLPVNWLSQLLGETPSYFMHLLLVEDDIALHTALQRSLVRAGLRVDVCSDGAQALATWSRSHPDVVVLDLSLPGVDGLTVLQQARKAGLQTPVLILTARGTVGDKVMGLNAGADDYLPKPFDLDELEARVRALHRRRNGSTPDTDDWDATVGPLHYDRTNGAIYLQQEVMDLTPREVSLLSALMARPGHAVAKERLFELVFPGEDQVQYEAIEVVVYRLRKKLVGTGVNLMTLRGLGYLLKSDR